MFSGIVKGIGSVVEVERHEERYRIAVESPLFRDASLAGRHFAVGDSIAINGVCLTVIEPEAGALQPPFRFDISSETLRRTTLGKVAVGTQLNIEPSLRMGDSLDGHLVQGHVDCVTAVTAIAEEGNTFRVEFALPETLKRLIAPKGSITLDGISLTVGEVGAAHFSVYIVPHTWKATTMHSYVVGDLVNVEADMIARYLERLLIAREVA